jgi:hypothetical protein
MARVLYDWAASRNPADFLLEGCGEIQVTSAGELLHRTFHLGPARKASNAWLRHLVLPERFRVSWRYRSDSAAGNTMILFNATPLLLRDLFEDSRAEARYCDLAGWRKMIAYTCGFHRGTYGNPCVLRKIGGNVPEDWGMLAWPSEQWKQCDQVTRLATTQEPLTPGEKGKWHDFVLERGGDRIRFSVNGAAVHDVADSGQYPFYAGPLTGGRMGFRNFGGPADDFYEQIRVEAID